MCVACTSCICLAWYTKFNSFLVFYTIFLFFPFILYKSFFSITKLDYVNLLMFIFTNMMPYMSLCIFLPWFHLKLVALAWEILIKSEVSLHELHSQFSFSCSYFSGSLIWSGYSIWCKTFVYRFISVEIFAYYYF